MNKDRKKVHFGLADVVIILLVLASISAAVWYFAADSVFDRGDDVKMTYELRITNLRSEMTSHIKVGDKVYDSVYGEAIGVVEDVRVEQYTEQVFDKNAGEAVNAVKAGYYNIYLKINTTAKQKDGVYYVADTEIRVGESMGIQAPDFCGNGFCTAVKLVGGEG